MAKEMTKEEIVDLLIDNTEITGWKEDDRETLENLGMGGLQRCLDLAEQAAATLNAGDQDNDDDDEDDEPMPKKGKGKGKGKKDYTKNAKKVKGDGDSIPDDDNGEDRQVLPSGKKSKGKAGRITGLQSILKSDEKPTDNEAEEQANLDEYVNNAPPAIREMLRNGVQQVQSTRRQLIDVIFNHENNAFTKEYLETLEMPELQGMAALVSNQKSKANYAGQGAAYVSPLRNEITEEPLPVQTWD